jgi:hypothetical protein
MIKKLKNQPNAPKWEQEGGTNPFSASEEKKE